jgi:hypothetical protein
MKSTAGLVFAGFLAASTAFSATYYALEVRGGSRVYAADQPVRKGRVFLFHRYPDGVYMSLAASEVDRVVSLPEPPQPEGLAPGQALFVAPALEGPGFQAPPRTVQAAPPADTAFMDPGYGYYGSYWGGGGSVPPPRPPGPAPAAPPSRIGPNGFPILAPPGSPGSTSPPIGANGFPILAPLPAPAPRPR